MIKQVLKKIKQFIKENIVFLIVFFILLIVLTYEFPYYIETPGGTIDVTDRIIVEDGYQSKGSFHLAYVSELKATIPTLILSKLKKDWDIIKRSEVVMEHENIEDVYFRDKANLEEANQNAIIVAYQKANKNVAILKQHLLVTYVDPLAKTELQVGDEITHINGKQIESKLELNEIIKRASIGDVFTFTVIRKQKTEDVTAEMIEYEGLKMIGLMLYEKKELKTDPKVSFHFKSSESGPSGGLMTTLSIYNQLVQTDITKGKKIVGTGTIALDGTVGEIAGVKYKLKGAEKGGADIFFVPNGKNYEEAIKLKHDLDYEIEVVGVSTFEDALVYLEKYIES